MKFKFERNLNQLSLFFQISRVNDTDLIVASVFTGKEFLFVSVSLIFHTVNFGYDFFSKNLSLICRGMVIHSLKKNEFLQDMNTIWIKKSDIQIIMDI